MRMEGWLQGAAMACSILALCSIYLLLILRESSAWAQTVSTESNCNSRCSVPFLEAFSRLILIFHINIGWEKEIKQLFSRCKLLLKLSVASQKCEWTLILTLRFSTSLHKKISVDTCYQLLVNTGKQAELKYDAERTKTAQEATWAYGNIMLDMFLS